MGQRDSSFKGPTFLACWPFTSFQRVWICGCFLICITRLSLSVSENLQETTFSSTLLVFFGFKLFATGQLFDRKISYGLEILVQCITCFLRDIWLIWWFWSFCVLITRNVYKASGVSDFSWISARSWKVTCASTCCERSGDEGQLFAASGSRKCLNCTKVATASCPNERARGKIRFNGNEETSNSAVWPKQEHRNEFKNVFPKKTRVADCTSQQIKLFLEKNLSIGIATF